MARDGATKPHHTGLLSFPRETPTATDTSQNRISRGHVILLQAFHHLVMNRCQFSLGKYSRLLHASELITEQFVYSGLYFIDQSQLLKRRRKLISYEFVHSFYQDVYNLIDYLCFHNYINLNWLINGKRTQLALCPPIMIFLA